MNNVRIGAFNIAHGRGIDASNWGGGGSQRRIERLRAIAQFLRSTELDVVVLNEVDFRSTWSHEVNQAEFLARAAGFPHWAEQRNFDIGLPGFSLQFGNAILSRYPIQEVERISLPAYSSFEAVVIGKKDAIACTLALPDGRPLRVMGVHLSNRSEAVRVASVELIEEMQREQTTPFVVAGDFNSGPLGFPEIEADPSGRTAVSVLLQQGWRTYPLWGPPAEEYTFSTKEPRKILDWVMVPPGPQTQLVDYRVHPIILSDHRPVIGLVRLPAVREHADAVLVNATAGEPPKLRWSAMD